MTLDYSKDNDLNSMHEGGVVVAGGWWLVVVGGGWWLVVGGGWWWLVVVGGWWWLVVGGGGGWFREEFSVKSGV
jgi:hypothetical protein